MKNRKALNREMTHMDLMVTMAEGNPGAVRVMIDILSQQGEEGYFTILILNDMNIRGSQLWIAYKDYAEEDLEVFVKAVWERSQEMVDVVNSVYNDHIAVVGGASYQRDR